QTYNITGKVTDGSNGETLIGANIFLKGTSWGAASDANGNYSITARPGSYTITCSYIGYEKVEKDIEVNGDMTLNFSLKEYQFTLSVTVISDRAKERETPVAFTNIDKKQMEFNLGSRDIPLVLNTAPSVFATDQGGGPGDARINVRGFNQRNVGIMINGIPINDMENGWVYWSNWDGLGDATSSIQLQRGLSSVTLATPSIGGTINVITDPTQHKAGAYFRNEFGTGNFHKQTFFGHTGLVDEKFAMSIGGVRKVGDGIVDRAWTDAWAYYMGMAYQINNSNRLELYAMGAPQQHGQRRWKLNAANFSHELARKLGYTEDILNDPLYADQGTLYNSNWSGVSTSYTGMQWQRSYWNSNLNQRYNPAFINESQNYYHKPLVNLNWYSQFSDKFSLYSTVYYSGGQGGGTGTFGSLAYNYDLKQRVIDYDATIARNIANIDTTDGTSSSRGILRNSVNTQWTIGAISKAFYKTSDAFTLSFGIDARYAEIEHFREVRDLLGGDYYVFTGNEFEGPADYRKLLGDRIDYNNTNTVNWLGGYVQGEYTKDKYTVYGTAGYSMIKYDYVDHFRTADTLSNGNPDINSGELNLVSDWIGGYQFKGGASFRATNDVQLYFNGGYVSQVPIFDQVISDVDAKFVENQTNNKFLSFELGTRTTFANNRVALNANLYYTQWMDRSTDRLIEDVNTGEERLIRLQGIDSRHMGFELDAAAQPVKWIKFDAAFSYGMWEYTDDVNGTYIIDFATGQSEQYRFFIKDLKVGDAPQMQLSAAVTLIPVPGLQAQLVWRLYDNYYSDFDPFSRIDSVEVMENGGKAPQVWQVPSYNIFDLNFSYYIPAKVAGANVVLFAHVFNIFNELYVQDAVDNSQYNGYTGNDEELGTHRADDAEIYPGLPTTFNLGFSITL
ncbi:MAG: TonB-dependent receptor, partial [Psychromonas sp.]|nr:TonB-dependent receptor [Psychromonas sp.]